MPALEASRAERPPVQSPRARARTSPRPRALLAWDEVVPPVPPGGRPIRRGFDLTTVPEMMRLIAAGAAVHLTVLSIGDVAPPTVRVLPVPDLPRASVQLTHLPDTHERVRAFVAACESAFVTGEAR